MRQRTLDIGPVDRIGPVEDNDFDVCLCSRLQEIAHGCFVGVKASAGILEINYNRIQVLEDFRRGAALRIRGAIDAVDGHTSSWVLRIRHIGDVELSGDSMFRRENCL